VNCKPIISTLLDCDVKLSEDDNEWSVDRTLFKSLVRSLWYLTCTRSDILYGVGLVSKYIEEPKSSRFKQPKEFLDTSKVHAITTNFTDHVTNFNL